MIEYRKIFETKDGEEPQNRRDLYYKDFLHVNFAYDTGFKNCKGYTAFKNIDDFLSFKKEVYTEKSDFCFYEQINTDFVEYYDIDGSSVNGIYKDKNELDIITEFIDARYNFQNYFSDIYKIKTNFIPKEHLYITYTPDLLNEKKISIHIIVRNNFYFGNISDIQKFTSIFQDYIIEKQYYIKFDKSVYSNNRCMRTLFSNKYGKPLRKKIRFSDYNDNSKYGNANLFFCNYLTGKEEKYDFSTLNDTSEPILLFIGDGDSNLETHIPIETGDIDKLINLISECIENENHSLCDDEILNKLNYNDWKKLAFAVIRETNGENKNAFNTIWELYRHCDDHDREDMWKNMCKKTNYGWTIKSLHYWAKQNNKYYEVFPEMKKIDDDKKDKYSYLIKKKISNDNSEKLSKIKYYHELFDLDLSKIYNYDNIIQIYQKCIFTLSNGGDTSFITTDRYYCDKSNKYFDYFSINELGKVYNSLSKFIFIFNDKYQKEKEEYDKLNQKEKEKYTEPLHTITYCMGFFPKMPSILKSLYQSNLLKNYKRICFKPYLYPIKNDRNSNDFNIFRGFNFSEEFLTSTKDEINLRCEIFKNSIFYKHINHIFCNNDSIKFNYYHSYIAHIIQKPTEQTHTFQIIASEQGAGKDTSVNLFENMIGKEYVLRLESINDLFKDFNSLQEGKLIVVVNEICDKAISLEIHNKLKDWISKLYINVNKKFIKQYTVENYARGFGFSQFSRNVIIEPSDRRNIPYICSDNIDGLNIINNSSYFSKLYKEEINNPDFCKSAFFFYASYDISKFNPVIHPQNTNHNELKLDYLNKSIKFILYRTQTLYNDEWTDFRYIKYNDSFIIKYQDLFDDFCFWCKEVEKVETISKSTFKQHLINFNLNANSKNIKINNISTKNTFIISKDIIQNLLRTYIKNPDIILDDLVI